MKEVREFNKPSQPAPEPPPLPPVTPEVSQPEATISGVIFVEHDPDVASDPPPSWFVLVTPEQEAQIKAFMAQHFEDFNPWVGPVVAIPFEQFKREVMDDLEEDA